MEAGRTEGADEEITQINTQRPSHKQSLFGLGERRDGHQEHHRCQHMLFGHHSFIFIVSKNLSGAPSALSTLPGMRSSTVRASPPTDRTLSLDRPDTLLSIAGTCSVVSCREEKHQSPLSSRAGGKSETNELGSKGR